MAGVQLFDHQYEALSKMKNGCILNGGTGTGKSITSIAYYFVLNGGEVNSSKYIPMHPRPKDLYIITTALKRDKKEWEGELAHFLMSTDPETSRYQHKIVVDSWNNIKKYTDVKNAFFIFDEQRVIGYGAWSKSFISISKKNEWILLSATPGDTWSDYIPVFIANGFYKNKSDFERQHAVYARWSKYPKIEKWINEGRLIRYRRSVLITMDMPRKTRPKHEYVTTEYNRLLYSRAAKDRWNVFTNEPIVNASEYVQVLRRIVNTDPSKLQAVMDILKEHPKAIIFYNYDYELHLLRKLFDGDYDITEYNEIVKQNIPFDKPNWVHLVDESYISKEWNGHRHDPLPEGEDKWTYLVQYLAGSEGWNCTITDTIIFFSENYSYRIMHQASGRIDRLNTPFIELYYYHLRSNAKVDLAIRNALSRKRKFNERAFAPVFEVLHKGETNEISSNQKDE